MHMQEGKQVPGSLRQYVDVVVFVQRPSACTPTMEECKSPEAEALVAAAVRGPNQAASAAA